MIYSHRELQPLIGASLLVWQKAETPQEDTFNALKHNATEWLVPNPRLYSHNWKIYPQPDGTYMFEGTDVECVKFEYWRDKEGGPYSY